MLSLVHEYVNFTRLFSQDGESHSGDIEKQKSRWDVFDKQERVVEILACVCKHNKYTGSDTVIVQYLPQLINTFTYSCS